LATRPHGQAGWKQGAQWAAPQPARVKYTWERHAPAPPQPEAHAPQPPEPDDSLSADAWAALLDEVLASDARAARSGTQVMQALQRVSLAEQARAADLALARVLARLDDFAHQLYAAPQPLLPLLDAHFGWSRDVSWRRHVPPDLGDRLMRVLQQSRSQQRGVPQQSWKSDHHRYSVPPKAPPPDAGLHEPPGWQQLAFLLDLWAGRKSLALGARLLAVLSLGFPGFVRPGIFGKAPRVKRLIGCALLLHLGLWLGVASLLAMACGRSGGQALLDAVGSYAGGGFSLMLVTGVLLGGVMKDHVSDSRLLNRWAERPWRAWVLPCLPAVLIVAAIHAPSSEFMALACVAFVAFPYIVAYLASGLPEWRARPGLAWWCVLFGVLALLLIIYDPLLPAVRGGYMPLLIMLPFTVAMVCLALRGLARMRGPHAGLAMAGLCLLAWGGVMLGLVWGQDWRAQPGLAQASLHTASMALAAGTLPWLLWWATARQGGIFWLHGLVLGGMLLAAQERAAWPVPYLVVGMLGPLLAAGVQHGMNGLALRCLSRRSKD
jgi:hypothetical protein